MKIKTDHWLKPIPDRRHDWEAWVDGQEEVALGTGPTETDAIADLMLELECRAPYLLDEVTP